MGKGKSDRHKITVLFVLPTMSPSDASPSVRMTTAAFLPITAMKRRDNTMIIIRLRRLQRYSVQVIAGKQSSYLLRVAEAR